ncbi:MAG TPA: peptide chain release factor N(5)-glutamine methyltransferase, partial [Coriobacteriia bacterium]
QGVSLLEDAGIAVARLTAEVLLSHAMGRERVYLYAHPERELKDLEWLHYGRYLHERLQGKPTQYITKKQEFYGREFRVSPDVLIPRPETEVLVDAGLPAIDAAIAERGESLVADVCTGSGCVALAIAQERPESRVVATDISPVAVEVAAENAARLGVSERVDVREGDLLAPLPEELRGSLDLLVSNPPYVPSADVPDLPAEVAGFEPHLALDGGADGLDVYRRLLREARGWLRPGTGLLAVELDERRVQQAAAEALQWYEDVKVVSDLTGRMRIVTARLPKRS